MLASLHAELAAFDAKWLMQRDGFEVFDGHLSREGDDVVELVYFAHRVVEDELQAHAVGIVHATDEAIVFLHFCVTGVVAVDLRLAWHGDDFNLTGVGAVQRESICRRWQVVWVLRWKTSAGAKVFASSG